MLQLILEITNCKTIIEKYYGEYWILEPSIWQQAPAPFEVAQSTPNEPDDRRHRYEIKQAAITILNYFEDFSAMYQRGHIDCRMMDHLLKAPIITMYEKLAPIREAMNRDYFAKSRGVRLYENNDTWNDLSIFIEDWKRRK